jgi:hypothetical protein
MAATRGHTRGLWGLNAWQQTSAPGYEQQHLQQRGLGAVPRQPQACRGVSCQPALLSILPFNSASAPPSCLQPNSPIPSERFYTAANFPQQQ